MRILRNLQVQGIHLITGVDTPFAQKDKAWKADFTLFEQFWTILIPDTPLTQNSVFAKYDSLQMSQLTSYLSLIYIFISLWAHSSKFKQHQENSRVNKSTMQIKVRRKKKQTNKTFKIWNIC